LHGGDGPLDRPWVRWFRRDAARPALPRSRHSLVLPL